jgi:hypothetical protein
MKCPVCKTESLNAESCAECGRMHETAQRMEERYLAKFGRVDYEHIQNVRGWLKDHPQSQMLLAFLIADDPYKI